MTAENGHTSATPQAEDCDKLQQGNIPVEDLAVSKKEGSGREAYEDDQQQPLLSNAEASRTGDNTDPTLSSPTSQFQIEAAINEASVLSRVNWHLLPIFFSLAMLCSIDRANLSFAALQLNHDLHFSKAVYGLGSGIFFVGYALFAIPSTFVCAKVGAPRFLGSILILWGLVATSFSCMTSRWQFYALRFILGLTESGAYPGMWFQLALFYTERELGLAYAIVSTASSLSGVAGGPLAAGLLKMDGVLGLHGWQWLFLMEGFPAVVLGIVVLCCLAKTPATAAFLLPDEREWLITRKESAAQKAAAPKMVDEEGTAGHKAGLQPVNALGSFLTMLREWRIWWLGATWAIVSVGIDGLVFWIPILIQAIIYGEDTEEKDELLSEEDERTLLKGQAVHSALLSSIPFTCAALGMVVIAYLAKRNGERHWHIAVPLLVATAALIVMPLVEGHVTWLAFAALTVGAVGIWAPHGPLMSWPAAILDGTAAASGFALIKMLGSFAAFASNAAIGELHEETGSFALPMFLLAGLMTCGAILAVTFKEPGQGSRVDVRPLIRRLHQRLKRSRSDPGAFYPTRTFSGSLSTIREYVARPYQNSPEDRFEMPSMQTRLEVRRLYPDLHGSAAERDAIEHSLRTAPQDPSVLHVI